MEQIRTGLGQPMGFTQDDITFAGIGIEYRIIAEDPANRFTPWVGRIDRFVPPEVSWASLHTQIPRDVPYDIPTEFDPNLALAIIWGKDLAEAKARGVEYLDKLVLTGQDQDGNAMKSNIAFLREMTANILVF